MLTPHRSKWGTCILQTWTTDFDSSKPLRLKVPTWVTLRGIPGEFLGVAKEIAGGLGELLGSDKRNAHTADQRFCVALQAGLGWQTQLAVTNENTGEKIVILVDYCNLPIRCRCCYSTGHLVKDCPGIKTPSAGDQTDGPPAEDRDSSTPGTAPVGTDGGAAPVIPPPPAIGGHNPTILVESSEEDSSDKERRLMGTNSEETTSRSGNHYSNGDSRETPP